MAKQGTGGHAAAAAVADAAAPPPSADAGSTGGDRKRKHAPIMFAPPARGSSRELKHQLSNASSEGGGAAAAAGAGAGGAAADNGGPLAPVPSADLAAAVAKAVEEAGDLPADATAALFIKGLRRPFTQAAFTQKLSETGKVKGMCVLVVIGVGGCLLGGCSWGWNAGY